jgi:hypothetical protein
LDVEEYLHPDFGKNLIREVPVSAGANPKFRLGRSDAIPRMEQQVLMATKIDVQVASTKFSTLNILYNAPLIPPPAFARALLDLPKFKVLKGRDSRVLRLRVI